MPTITLVDGSPETEGVPVGALMAWALPTPPPRWLVCNGQEVSIDGYPVLYRVLTSGGTVFPYGANTNGSGAAGSTHFRLPTLVDRHVALAATAADRGTTGGANTHNHTISPTYPNVTEWARVTGGAHTHSVSNGSAPNYAFLGAGGAHDHGSYTVTLYAPNTVTNQTRGGGNYDSGSTSHAHSGGMTAASASADHSHWVTLDSTYSAGDHSHGVTVNSSASSTTNSNANTDDTPPHLQLHYVVCAVPA